MGGGGQQQFTSGQGGAPNFTPQPNTDQQSFMSGFDPAQSYGNLQQQLSSQGLPAAQYWGSQPMAGQTNEPGMMPALQRMFGIGLASEQGGQGGLFDPSTIGVPSQLPPGSNTGGGTFNRDLWNFEPDLSNRPLPFFHAPPLYPGKVF